MEVYVNYPTTEEGWKEFRKAVADVHAFLVVDTIKNLPLSDESKKKVLKGVVEVAKNRALEEEKLKKENKKSLNKVKIDLLNKSQTS